MKDYLTKNLRKNKIILSYIKANLDFPSKSRCSNFPSFFKTRKISSKAFCLFSIFLKPKAMVKTSKLLSLKGKFNTSASIKLICLFLVRAIFNISDEKSTPITSFSGNFSLINIAISPLPQHKSKIFMLLSI